MAIHVGQSTFSAFASLIFFGNDVIPFEEILCQPRQRFSDIFFLANDVGFDSNSLTLFSVLLMHSVGIYPETPSLATIGVNSFSGFFVASAYTISPAFISS